MRERWRLDKRSPWIRVEMVLRGDHANAFVAQLTVSDTVGKLAAQVLNDKLAFIERDDKSGKGGLQRVIVRNEGALAVG